MFYTCENWACGRHYKSVALAPGETEPPRCSRCGEPAVGNVYESSATLLLTFSNQDLEACLRQRARQFMKRGKQDPDPEVDYFQIGIELETAADNLRKAQRIWGEAKAEPTGPAPAPPRD